MQTLNGKTAASVAITYVFRNDYIAHWMGYGRSSHLVWYIFWATLMSVCRCAQLATCAPNCLGKTAHGTHDVTTHWTLKILKIKQIYRFQRWWIGIVLFRIFIVSTGYFYYDFCSKALYVSFRRTFGPIVLQSTVCVMSGDMGTASIPADSQNPVSFSMVERK